MGSSLPAHSTGAGAGVRRTAATLAVAFTLALLGTSLASCNETRKAQAEYREQERQRTKAIKKVTERVEGYLLAMRWRDFQEGAKFYEDTVDQVAFLQRMTDPSRRFATVDETRVDFVVVDETNERAEVQVTYTEVDPATLSLGSRSDTLLWYFSGKKLPKDWFLIPVVALEPN